MPLMIGDLVRPRPGTLNLSSNTVGIVAALRRQRVQVWFPDHHIAPWLKQQELQQLRPRGDVRAHPWSLVSWLIRATGAVEFEWEMGRPFRLSTLHRQYTDATHQQVVEFLGPRLRSWSVRPSGMSVFWIDWFLDLPPVPQSSIPENEVPR